MFYGCTRLVGEKGTFYDENHVDAAYAHIDGGLANPGYLTEWKEAYACYMPENMTLTLYNDSKRINLTDNATDYTVVVGCNAAEGQKVTIAARPESLKRALLYNVTFYSGDATVANAPARIASETGDSTQRVITGITDTTYVVRNLTREGTFNFKVEAVYTDGTTSAASNIETVTLGGEDELEWMRGDVNADGHVDVTDMNILINIVLEKDDANNYERRAYILGGDSVSIEDINALINILLAQ